MREGGGEGWLVGEGLLGREVMSRCRGLQAVVGSTAASRRQPPPSPRQMPPQTRHATAQVPAPEHEHLALALKEGQHLADVLHKPDRGRGGAGQLAQQVEDPRAEQTEGPCARAAAQYKGPAPLQRRRSIAPGKQAVPSSSLPPGLTRDPPCDPPHPGTGSGTHPGSCAACCGESRRGQEQGWQGAGGPRAACRFIAETAPAAASARPGPCNLTAAPQTQKRAT